MKRRKPRGAAHEGPVNAKIATMPVLAEPESLRGTIGILFFGTVSADVGSPTSCAGLARRPTSRQGLLDDLFVSGIGIR